MNHYEGNFVIAGNFEGSEDEDRMLKITSEISSAIRAAAKKLNEESGGKIKVGISSSSFGAHAG